MTRIAFSFLFLSALVLSSCENKPSENGDSQTKDTIQQDTVSTVSADTVQQTTSAGLSEKAKMVAGKWQLTELETSDMKLSGELIDIRFDFKEDMTFVYSENGKKDKGTWKLNEQENQVMLTYESEAKSDLDIKELKEGKMTLSGKEHGMYRTYKLETAK